MRTTFKLFYVICAVTMLVISCKQQSEPAPPDGDTKIIIGNISVFGVSGVQVTYDTLKSTYNITVPKGTDIKNLRLLIPVIKGTTITPDHTKGNDFTNPVNFTLVAPSGDKKTITVKVTIKQGALSKDKRITGFYFTAFSPKIEATINPDTYKITAVLPHDADLTSLVPTIVLGENATVSPASGVAQNFTKAVTYTVTAEDGGSQLYEVKIDRGIMPGKTDIVFIDDMALDGATGKPIWKFKAELGRETTSNTVAVFDNAIYLTAGGWIYAMDLFTGKEIWKINPSFSHSGSPVVSEGILYCTGYTGAYDQKISKVFAVDIKTGGIKWETQVGKSAQEGSVVHNGIVYCPIDKKIVALDAKSGTKKWEKTIPLKSQYLETISPDIMSNPCIADNKLFFTDLGFLYTIDLTTNNLTFRELHSPIGYISARGPTMSNGVIYLKSGSGITGIEPRDSYPSKNETLEFTPTAIGFDPPSPIISDNVVYVGSGKSFYALEAGSLQQKWKISVEDFVISSAVVANGVAYFGSRDGMFYAVDASTGVKKWSYLVDNEMYSSPVVVTAAGAVHHPSISGMQQ
ncbi:outer membrane protein assembly factor BamB family protein [Dyadobacter bucti]|uniref:outer membrane protein assembly factor BamB family protein n=1 Tax=Dyadobacter bucti TaxID=2572203 RepID=UPI003F6EC04B